MSLPVKMIVSNFYTSLCSMYAFDYRKVHTRLNLCDKFGFK